MTKDGGPAKVKVELELSTRNEATSYPYWLIIDPMQMTKPSVDAVGCMITGPFFSRESAEAHLIARHYAFSNRARAYCQSGYYSLDYRKALEEADYDGGLVLAERETDR